MRTWAYKLNRINQTRQQTTIKLQSQLARKRERETVKKRVEQKRYNKIFTVNKRKFAYALLHHQNIKNYFSSLPIFRVRFARAVRVCDWRNEQILWVEPERQWAAKDDGKWLCTIRCWMLAVVMVVGDDDDNDDDDDD